MKFIAEITFAADLSKIAEIRPKHRIHMEGLLASGKLLLAGPFEDLKGAIALYEADSAEEVDTMVRNDPYFPGGIFQSWTVRPWRMAFVNPDYLR